MCSIFAGFGNIFDEINITALVPLFTVTFLCNYVYLNGILFNSRYLCCVMRWFNVHKGSIDQKDRFLLTSLFLWSLH